MNLENVLKGRLAPEEVGAITDLKQAGMPVSGLERIASVICAMASKLLELVLPLYGADSEEGKRLMRAIRTLSPLTKGVRAEDIAAVLKVVETVITGGTLPPEQMALVRGLAMRSPFVTETGTIPDMMLGLMPNVGAGTGAETGTEEGEAGLEEVLAK